MSSQLRNLSVTTLEPQEQFRDLTIAIVVAEWNKEITGALLSGAVDFLLSMGMKEDHISVHKVPGSFELTLGSQYCASLSGIDAVIALGCVIQGETRHFDFICQAVASGITDVALKYNKPVVFGVLTPDTHQQALDRAGGKHGNKGIEAAETALKMLLLAEDIGRAAAAKT